MLQHANSNHRSLLNVQKMGEWAIIPAALILMLAVAAIITMAIAWT
jgi:hypothetical protein